MNVEYVLFYTKFNKDGYFSSHKFFEDYDKLIDFIIRKKLSLSNCIIFKKVGV